MQNAGDTCPKCRCGRLKTRSSVQYGEDQQVRYLECSGCEYRTKAIVPAAKVWRRSFVSHKQER